MVAQHQQRSLSVRRSARPSAEASSAADRGSAWRCARSSADAATTDVLGRCVVSAQAPVGGDDADTGDGDDEVGSTGQRGR